ncbi:hypothetical protein ACSQ67_010044 [Phaseolus vulgaris]
MAAQNLCFMAMRSSKLLSRPSYLLSVQMQMLSSSPPLTRKASPFFAPFSFSDIPTSQCVLMFEFDYKVPIFLPILYMSIDAQSVASKLTSSGLLRTQGLIGGKWTDAYDGKTIKVYNPATGESIVDVACMGGRETNDAISAAYEAYR